jgi:iron complex transport system substrate-binding protein
VRIVSLLPSATEAVCRLGLETQLVGVSADSDWPPEVVKGLPVLNTISIDTSHMTSREIDQAATQGHRGVSLYHVDPERLRSLRPDLILTQEMCEVCGVSRRDVELAAGALGYAPRVLSLNGVTLEQVLEDVELVARETGATARGRALIGGLSERLEAVRRRTTGLLEAPPKVLCMEWLDPVWSAGHWIPEMVELAGGREELGIPGGPSRQIDWQDVVAYEAEVIVLMPCSLDLQRVADEFEVLTALPGWDSIPAVRSRQVYAGHTDLFSRPGPRLVDGVELLARVLHPELFAQPLAAELALRISDDGQRLEPFR